MATSTCMVALRAWARQHKAKIKDVDFLAAAPSSTLCVREGCAGKYVQAFAKTRDNLLAAIVFKHGTDQCGFAEGAKQDVLPQGWGRPFDGAKRSRRRRRR